MAQLGYEYAKLEDMGVVSPVTKVECQYKVPTTFADELRISVLVEDISFARLRLRYKMINQRSVVCCSASSEHCFVSPEGKIVRIDRDYPEFFAALKEQSEANSL